MYQKTSDYVVKSDLIFTDGLLDFQPLDEIKFFGVLYKTYIADTWVLRRKSLSAFWCKIRLIFIKAICHIDIVK